MQSTSSRAQTIFSLLLIGVAADGCSLLQSAKGGRLPTSGGNPVTSSQTGTLCQGPARQRRYR
jgi:hypothetical protein